MCFSNIGKVVKIEGERVLVETGKRKVRKFSPFLKVKKGDWVLFSNQIIVQKIKEKDAVKFFNLLLKGSLKEKKEGEDES